MEVPAMARKSPAFSFYPDSFLGGTLTMSTAEVGVYIKLLSASWLHGQLSFSFCLAFCSDIDLVLVERVLKSKFVEIEPGQWINERLEEEREKQRNRSENGKKGGRPKANDKANQKLNGKLNAKLIESPDSDSDSSKEDRVLTDSSPEAVDQSEPAAAGSPAPKPPEGEEPFELKPPPEAKAKRKRTPKPIDPNRATMEDVLDCWEHYWGKKIQLTDSRKKSLGARLRNDWWEQNFAEGCRRATESEFLNGSSPSGWVATFDWFIRPNTLAKIMEGAYDKHKKDPYASFQKFSAASQG
jgi:uncharacterized protein YdaU (DUF1376 family)